MKYRLVLAGKAHAGNRGDAVAPSDVVFHRLCVADLQGDIERKAETF